MTPILAFIPKVALASIVLVAVIKLIHIREVLLNLILPQSCFVLQIKSNEQTNKQTDRQTDNSQAIFLWRVCKRDFVSFMVIVIATLILGVQAALILGILVSWILFLGQNHPADAFILTRPDTTFRNTRKNIMSRMWVLDFFSLISIYLSSCVRVVRVCCVLCACACIKKCFWRYISIYVCVCVCVCCVCVCVCGVCFTFSFRMNSNVADMTNCVDFMDLDLEQTFSDHVVVLRLYGDLRFATAGYFKRLVEQIITTEPVAIVVDCTTVIGVDSSGVVFSYFKRCLEVDMQIKSSTQIKQ